MNIIKATLESIEHAPRMNIKNLEEIVSGVVAKNFNDLLMQCKNTSVTNPNLASVDTVKRTYRVKALPVFLATLIVATTIAGTIPTKDINVTVAELAKREPQIGMTLDGHDSTEVVGNYRIAYQGELAEAVDALEKPDVIDELGGTAPEVFARRAAQEKMDKIKSYEDNIVKIKQDFAKIAQTTNAQWIDYQMKLYSGYSDILEVEKEILQETNDHLSEHINLNNEHINLQNMTQKAIDEHNDEITANQDQIARNNSGIQYREGVQAETAKKLAFYEQLKKTSNLEAIENIADASETLYSFFETDVGKDLGIDVLEGKDINLFSAFAKTYVSKELSKTQLTGNEFLQYYLLMENSYNTYVERYCEGDYTKVNETDYAQFFVGSVVFMDNLGEAGIISTTWALRDQTAINESFNVQQNNGEKMNFFERVSNFLDICFDGERRGEYEEVIKAIEDINRDVKNVGISHDETGGDI